MASGFGFFWVVVVGSLALLIKSTLLFAMKQGAYEPGGIISFWNEKRRLTAVAIGGALTPKFRNQQQKCD